MQKFTYKELHISQMDRIRQEILGLTPPETLQKQNFYSPSFSKNILNTPALKSLLLSLGMSDSILSMHYNIMPSGASIPIHIDKGHFRYSLNLPILGINKTYLRFYRNNQIAKLKKLPNGVKYYGYSDENSCQLLNEFETTKPFIMKTKTPHDVINRSDQTRLTVLIRLELGWAPHKLTYNEHTDD